jgi:sirohydrochlorin ferrochelatase
MDALILFSHGSLLCGAGEALFAHAARLRDRGQWPLVEAGYLNYSEPGFGEAVSRCVAGGATRIVVLPYFLVPGYFVQVSLPKQVEKAKKDHPEVEFVIAEALGFDERLADALIDAALHPIGTDQWRDDLTVAARSCRARPDCPLYATPSCPRVPAPSTPNRPYVE